MAYWDAFKQAPTPTRDVSVPYEIWTKLSARWSDVRAKARLPSTTVIVTIPANVDTAYLRKLAGSDEIFDVIDVEGVEA